MFKLSDGVKKALILIPTQPLPPVHGDNAQRVSAGHRKGQRQRIERHHVAEGSGNGIKQR